MIRILWQIFLWLVAPHESEAKEMWAVRLILTLMTVANMALFWGHYVWAGEHVADKKDVTDLQKWQLQSDLINVIKWECRAQEEGNTDAQSFAFERKQQLLEEYKTKIGEHYPAPNCNQVRQS